MSGIDVLTKKFLSDHDRFAEIFNTFVFKGRQIVNSEKLSDLNPNEEFYDEKSRRTIERQRDILKLLELMMSDGKVGYLLLGAENQTEIHYSLPSRMMVYDGLLYSLQMEQHFEQKKKSKKKISGSEFLSRSVRDAKVHPVVTLVIYWGKEKWDAPLCLHEMMDIESAEPVRDVIPDFRINLLDMNDVPDEVIDTLQLSLKQVMYFRKYSDDREKLKILLEEKNSMFEKVERDTACFLRELTKTPFPIPEEGETINMCEAVRQMIDEEVANEKARSKEALAKERVKRKEAVEKEKEKYLKTTFSLISEMNPDLSSDEICRVLARKFKININLVRKIVLC